jgi:hypothetical protein
MSDPTSFPTDFPDWKVRIWKDNNGKHHREDGPAVEYFDGQKYWWYHGEYIAVSSQREFEKFLRLKAFW